MRIDDTKTNIVLIGMPGCGKSTVGVLLAKALCVDFTDTDLILQRSAGRPLKSIIDEEGTDRFLDMEADMICGLDIKSSVIATGGSAVCRQRAADALKADGLLVWIDTPYETLERRLGGIVGIRARGVAISEGQDLHDIFDQRRPLYEAAADIRISCPDGADAGRCCELILEALTDFK